MSADQIRVGRGTFDGGRFAKRNRSASIVSLAPVSEQTPDPALAAVRSSDYSERKRAGASASTAPEVQFLLAQNRNVTADELRHVARTSTSDVTRLSVAMNRQAPTDVLHALSREPNQVIAQAARQHRRYSPEGPAAKVRAAFDRSVLGTPPTELSR